MESSTLVQSTTPKAAQQYVRVPDVLDGSYENYVLTVNHADRQVNVWIVDSYSKTVELDRSFDVAGFQESVAWMRTAAVDEQHEDDLGRWTKESATVVEMYLPCGDSFRVSIIALEELAAALATMESVERLEL